MPTSPADGRALSQLTPVPDVRATDRLAVLRPDEPLPDDQNVTIAFPRVAAALLPAVLSGLGPTLATKADRDPTTGLVVPAQLPIPTWVGLVGGPLQSPALFAILFPLISGGANYLVRTYAAAAALVADAQLDPGKFYRLTNRPTDAGTDVLVQAVGGAGFNGDDAYTIPAGLDDVPPVAVAYDFATDAVSARPTVAPVAYSTTQIAGIAFTERFEILAYAALLAQIADGQPPRAGRMYRLTGTVLGTVQGVFADPADPDTGPFIMEAATRAGYAGLWRYDATNNTGALVQPLTTDEVLALHNADAPGAGNPYATASTVKTIELDGGNLITQPSTASGNTIGENADPTATFTGNRIDTTGSNNRIGLNAAAGTSAYNNSISGAGASGNSISGAGASGNSISGANAQSNSISGAGAYINSISGAGASGNSISGANAQSNSISGANANANTITGNSAQANSLHECNNCTVTSDPAGAGTTGRCKLQYCDGVSVPAGSVDLTFIACTVNVNALLPVTGPAVFINDVQLTLP